MNLLSKFKHGKQNTNYAKFIIMESTGLKSTVANEY